VAESRSASAVPQPAAVQTGTPPQSRAQERYVALDAFRGFIMFLLASNGLGFGPLQGHPVYGGVAGWFEHVEWTGAVFWDLIQPAFMFMVGVAMPFALAKRDALGASARQNFGHISVRALKLVLLSQFLVIASDGHFSFQLINVLSQMAFTYFFTYLILQMRPRAQGVAAVLLLAFHSALFFLFPGPDGAFSREGNIGAVIDKAILGRNYSGYYVTINFISSTVTTLFGAWTGILLRSARPRGEKLRILAIATVSAFAGGLALSPLVPIIKRIWTASFTLYSAGWVLAMMLGFVFVIDVRGWRKWTFPLLVVGMNSIFIYSCGFLIRDSVQQWVMAFSGGFKFAGDLAPVAQNLGVMLVLWYLCYFLYNRKIFLKV
jgi:heparan-alpha-glucosaminide N-acetyltransferase